MWFKVDDRFHEHEKVRGLDPFAVGVWALAGSWCGQNKTDGFVPDTVVARWGKRWRNAAKELVERDLWEPAERGREVGWVFVNWMEWQPSREETDVPLDRLRWRRKNALKKNRGLCDEIVQRDRNQCRYCGVRVNWADRRSPRGATFDHIDPDGDNTRENVVVACRRCNGRKKDRTPHEAGMELRPEPGPYTSGSGAKEPEPNQNLSGAIGGLARETVRDQVGTGSVRVGPGSVEPDPARVPVHSTNGASQ